MCASRSDGTILSHLDFVSVFDYWQVKLPGTPRQVQAAFPLQGFCPSVAQAPAHAATDWASVEIGATIDKTIGSITIEANPTLLTTSRRDNPAK